MLILLHLIALNFLFPYWLPNSSVQWIRENMLELAETVTSEGGNSDVSDAKKSIVKQKKTKNKYDNN